MACFLVPTAEAIVVTAATLIVKAKEKKSEPQTFTNEAKDGTIETREKISLSRKLNWLNALLWGGSILLAFEHLWHGEISPFFPFLTAMSSPESTAVMLSEMSTVGVMMAVLVTVVWIAMVGVCAVMEHKALKQARLKAHA
ncbi:MAG: hypothetical protein ACI4XC_05545 [Eubacterium sp.]